MPRYLGIRNWRRHQHYRDRRPPWVKFYTDVVLDEEFMALSVETRLVAVLLLAVAGNRENLIPDEASWIAAEMNVSVPAAKRALSDLKAIKFLVPASEVASAAASGSASEVASAAASGSASEVASASRAPARSRQRQRQRDEPSSESSLPLEAKRRRPAADSAEGAPPPPQPGFVCPGCGESFDVEDTMYAHYRDCEESGGRVNVQRAPTQTVENSDIDPEVLNGARAFVRNEAWRLSWPSVQSRLSDDFGIDADTAEHLHELYELAAKEPA